MDVRAHVAMVFHLDKCIGCHTCSIACKNIWTDRPGAEYMWWNNVETKPGTGYPTLWENQINYKGGWKLNGKGDLTLRSQSRVGAYLKLFYNPSQPSMDDYYEPWTYRYQELFNAEAADDQPTAVPVSQVTGELIQIESGPNWDDDLSGSPVYAENDPNLELLSEEERLMLFEIERIAMMYLPRICNHCANPSCVASCASGALYKRGEDGVVLINQELCRGWRLCVTACPYKKIYFNWQTGKSEKCILCYPRLETGQPPACFHSCVGRIRYLGLLLYDAECLPQVMQEPEKSLVESQREILLDPNDPKVVAAAEQHGISSEFIESAQNSPVWKEVMEWKLALPLHPEFRTMPMLFYVPPLLPIIGRVGNGIFEQDTDELFAPSRKLASRCGTWRRSRSRRIGDEKANRRAYFHAQPRHERRELRSNEPRAARGWTYSRAGSGHLSSERTQLSLRPLCSDSDLKRRSHNRRILQSRAMQGELWTGLSEAFGKRRLKNGTLPESINSDSAPACHC